MAEASMSSKLVAEFTGTFLLIFTIGCNVLGQTATWAGVSIACVLMVCIYSFGGISGANFNPAVSYTLGLSKTMGGPGMDWKDVGMYSAVQIIAGMVAGLSYYGLFGKTFNLAPAKGFDWLDAFLCEMLYTFMLCFVVLNVAVASKTTPNHYYGLAIGFVIVAGAYGAGAVSGGCFNPAVAIGIDLASIMQGFGYCLVYVIAQLIGAKLAVGSFRVCRPTEFGAEETPMLSKLKSEFIGTYFLVLTVGLNVMGKSPAGAFSIAASLMCMIYALGDVSGAHFNPAVTLAIYWSKLCPDLTSKDAGLYILAQLKGGILAALTYFWIYGLHGFPLGPVGNHTWGQVSVAEIVFTFVLCTVVLGAAVSSKTKTDTAFGLAIGSCVTVGGCAIGGISGGSLNPAVSWSIGITSMFSGGLWKALVYTILEFIGAGLAAAVISATHGDAKEDKEDLSA